VWRGPPRQRGKGDGMETGNVRLEEPGVRRARRVAAGSELKGPASGLIPEPPDTVEVKKKRC
jgi:hypothetical protein